MTQTQFDRSRITESLNEVKDSEDPGALLSQVLQSKDNLIPSEDIGKILLENYPGAMNSGIGQLVQQVVSKILLSNCAEEDFYTTLGRFMLESPLLDNDEEREAALAVVLSDPRLPYFELNLVNMSDEEFNKRALDNEELIDKLRRVSLRTFTQKTEHGSAVLDLILQLDSEEDRAVLMGIYLSSISSQGIELRQVPSE